MGKGAKMNPSRRVLAGVFVGLVLALATLSSPVRAQFYEDARYALELAPDPLARSPRLVGMGGLSLVVDDDHNRIDLWDFAHSPTGIMDADSNSTLELRPNTSSRSDVSDRTEGPLGGDRQE